jgi:hypothetical protein
MPASQRSRGSHARAGTLASATVPPALVHSAPAIFFSSMPVVFSSSAPNNPTHLLWPPVLYYDFLFFRICNGEFDFPFFFLCIQVDFLACFLSFGC